MRRYTVVWTYLGNYDVRSTDAQDEFDAMDKVVGFFSDDFRAKGTVYVFEGDPKAVREPLIPRFREKGVNR